jgi:hypothetical protein
MLLVSTLDEKHMTDLCESPGDSHRLGSPNIDPMATSRTAFHALEAAV